MLWCSVTLGNQAPQIIAVSDPGLKNFTSLKQGGGGSALSFEKILLFLNLPVNLAAPKIATYSS